MPLTAVCALPSWSQHTKLCGAVATATQEFGVKALLTLSSMTLTYVVALLALA